MRLQVLAQGSAPGLREQFVVGQAAPQEIGESRGQRIFIDRMNGCRIGRVRLQLAAKKKMRRNQHRLQRQLDSLLEAVLFLLGQRDETGEAIHFIRADWPAVGALRKMLKYLTGS